MPGIPERFYRIAKHKLTEVKDRLDQAYEEAEERQVQRDSLKSTAEGELKDSLESPRAFPDSGTKPAPSSSSQPLGTGNPSPRPRTPEEIIRSSGNSSGYSPPLGNANQNSTSDPLLFHYKLLGVEPGSDFVTVQGAYNSLATRSDPSRFPAGSEEETQAKEIRARLNESFKVLREALDPTSRRFDMLEI